MTFNDIPLSQACSAEQLKVSTALAMAANPEIRVVLIRDGSLLDSKNMAALREMADEHDFQVWVERVVESGQNPAIIIEEGEVKNGSSTDETPVRSATEDGVTA